MEWLPFALLLLGIGIAIIGWLFDRLSQIDWLLKRVNPRYYHGTQALRLLAENERRALLPKHPGFHILLELWPSTMPVGSVALLGRSVAFVEFGPTVSNDFELIKYDSARNEVSTRWKYSEAIKKLSEAHHKNIFWLGTVVFFLGITITLISGLINLFND